LKCIGCYGVGAEPVSPRGGSVRLRLPKVKRGLGRGHGTRLPTFVPSKAYCSEAFKNRDTPPIFLRNQGTPPLLSTVHDETLKMSLAIVLEGFISAPPPRRCVRWEPFRPIARFFAVPGSDASGVSGWWVGLGSILVRAMSGAGSTASSKMGAAPLAVFSSRAEELSALVHDRRRRSSVFANGIAWPLLASDRADLRRSSRKLQKTFTKSVDRGKGLGLYSGHRRRR
jgi:hypothetical protein